MQCLLIETKDHRKFFTHEKYLTQLIEFGKTFNAEISLVQIENGEVLDLEELAPALCDNQYKKNKSEYKTIELKFPLNKKDRRQTLKIASEIKSYIKTQFEEKKPVSLKNIKSQFSKYNLNNTTICNHVRKSKEELEELGYKFKKVGAGVYQVV